MITPTIGKQYRHHSGRIYKVICFANEQTQYPDKFPVMVVYKNVDNGTVWARSLSEWVEKFGEVT